MVFRALLALRVCGTLQRAEETCVPVHMCACTHRYRHRGACQGSHEGRAEAGGPEAAEVWKKRAEPDLRDGTSQCPFLPPHPRAKVLRQEAQDLGQL